MSAAVSPGTVPTDVTTLPTDVCWRLLRKAQVGRLAVVVDGEAEIFPVNHAVDGGTLVFRSARGTKLAAALASQRVAFEVDGVDLDTDAGAGRAWSVVVRGRARQVEGAHALVDTVGLPLFPWHAGPKPHFVRLQPDQLTGRSFQVAPPEAWLDPQTAARPAGPG